LKVPIKIAMVIPPQWTAAQPPMAACSLNGTMRRAGHDSRVWDLNAEFVHYVTDPSTLKLSAHRLQSAIQSLPLELSLRLGTGDLSHEGDIAAARLTAVRGYLQGTSRAQLEGLMAGAREAPAMLMSHDAFFDPVRYQEAQVILEHALKLFSVPFYPCEVKWNDFAHAHVPFNLEPLHELAASRVDNPFRAFYQDWIPRILDTNPRLITVSVNAFSQVAPGLTFALMLKEAITQRGANVHVSLGGNFFSRLREKLLTQPAFFEIFADSVVIGEGERPNTALCAVLDGKGTLADVPALLWADGQTLRGNDEAPNFKMDEMAFQDLADMPLERYLAPERVLCVRASKGCYYAECTFCDSHHGLQMDTVQVARLVEELTFLRDRYGVRNFEFVDQCISPAYMQVMCDAFIAARLDVHWFCNARTEPGFTPELFARMKQAGNTMVMWGVETGSARLLKLMKKGVSPKGRLDILRAASDAGIFNFAYVFFGFPTETREEAQLTIDLISQNTDIIHAYGRSVFSLGKHSPLMKDADHYGVLSYVEDDQEFSTNLTFESKSGMSCADLTGVLQACMDQCFKAYGGPLWMTLRSREALHLYLARHGRNYVQSYRFPKVDSSKDQPEFAF
jgi:hypothetical protein